MHTDLNKKYYIFYVTKIEFSKSIYLFINYEIIKHIIIIYPLCSNNISPITDKSKYLFNNKGL